MEFLKDLSWSDINFANSPWTQIFVIIFVTLFLHYLTKKIFVKIQKKAELTKTLWDDAFIWSAKGPVLVFILLLGGRFVAMILQSLIEFDISVFVSQAMKVGVVTIGIWYLVRVTKRAEELLKTPGYTREPLDETTVTAISKLIRVSLIITGILIVAQTLGFSVQGVLAFGGIGGFAVGFASKDLLANFFGGLMIYLDRPFNVGDWVRSPDRTIEGTVMKIGWRITEIKTFDKRPLYIPNSTFTNIALENPSRMSHRRIYETFGIRYDDVAKMSVIIEDIKQMLIEHPDIADDQTLIVNFNQFNASSLDFFIYTFTKTTDWIEFHKVKHDVLLKVSDIVLSHEAEFAYPTQTLHVHPEVEKLNQGNHKES